MTAHAPPQPARHNVTSYRPLPSPPFQPTTKLQPIPLPLSSLPAATLKHYPLPVPQSHTPRPVVKQEQQPQPAVASTPSTPFTTAAAAAAGLTAAVTRSSFFSDDDDEDALMALSQAYDSIAALHS